MPAKSLSDAFCRNVRPPLKTDKPNQTVYFDKLDRGLALVLVVSYGGSKTFRAMTYRNGKPHTRKLGQFAPPPKDESSKPKSQKINLEGTPPKKMSVKEARAWARAYYDNPEKIEAAAEVGTFEGVADEWFKRHVEQRKLRSARNIRLHLDNYVYPRWRDRDFLSIRRREVNELLDEIVDNHGPAIADGVLATIRGIANWHATRDEDYVSPVVRGMKRNSNGARERVLDDAEIQAVWKADGQFGALVKLLLLTGQRREKVATMMWDDLKGDEWTIRTEDREKGNAGALRLPPMVLHIINEQPRLAENPYVFAGRGGGPLNAFSQRKAELDAKLPAMPPWVLHDLRRSARSLLARADVRPDIAERVMGHAIAGVEGVYDRHQYYEQKGDALARLAALIETIINPPAGNVVSMRKGRRR